ncbi:MAG: ABC transporter permease [Vicinamibacterales bacterium]
MTSVLQDLRYAVRSLSRSPGFAAVVVLTLGLGIGANTAIFSLLDQVVLRALDVSAADDLVQLDGPGTFLGRTSINRAFSHPMFRDLRQGETGFSALIARAPASVAFRVGDESERVIAEMISGNTFQVLGATPALGRLFTAEDDVVKGGHPLIVLTDVFWRRRFNADPGVVGRQVVVNATPMTIIGVTRPGFYGLLANEQPAFFVPTTMKAAVTPTRDDFDDRQTRWLNVVGRLAPGVSREQAKAAADVRYQQINAYELEAVPDFAANSERFKERFLAKRLVLHDASRGLSQIRGDFSGPVAVLMGMVGLVLLIACANVANLMLARATGRQREISVRLAVGASRARLVRQTLVESAVVAVLGGACGLLVAAWLGDLLLGVLPLDGAALATTPDGRVLAFTLVVSVATAVLFGLAPALRGSAIDLNRALKEEASAAGGGVQHARLRKTLVVAQVALSTLLVAGAGLFARSLNNLEALGPGFDTDHMVTFAVNPPLSGYSQAASKQLFARLAEDLARQPGVTSVSLADEPLLTGDTSRRTIQVQGYQPQQGEDMNPWTWEIGTGYFATLGVPIVAGRDFSERDGDGAPMVAIVNETFARYFFGDENPIGRRFGFAGHRDPGRMEIVGVVKDTVYSQVRPGEAGGDASGTLRVPNTGVPRVVFTPYQQSAELGEMTFYLRSTAAAAPALPALAREAVQRVDRGLPVFAMTTLATTVDESLAVERMLALLSTLFGGLATTLAAVGLYGLMSYSVARRTREIGIRIALGAARPDVLGLVLRDVAILTGIGIAVGLPGAYAIGRAAESRLFGLSPLDPWSLALAAGLLAVVSLGAGFLPARRAAATQPLLALRAE